MTTVDQYLRSLAAHDWQSLRGTLADEGLVRIGPYCDEVRGADEYVAYLQCVMTSLENYTLNLNAVLFRDWPLHERKPPGVQLSFVKLLRLSILFWVTSPSTCDERAPMAAPR